MNNTIRFFPFGLTSFQRIFVFSLTTSILNAGSPFKRTNGFSNRSMNDFTTKCSNITIILSAMVYREAFSRTFKVVIGLDMHNPVYGFNFLI